MNEPFCDICGDSNTKPYPVHSNHPKCICTIHSRRIPSVPTFYLFCCPFCELLFVHPKLPNYELFYSKDYYQWYFQYEKQRREDVVMAYNHVCRITGLQNGKLLDAGCGVGFFLEYAREQGWEAEGTEISSYASDYVQKKGIPVFNGTLEQYASDAAKRNSFDLITLWGVLAHIPYPGQLLNAVYALLKPGGFIAILTPNAQWALFQYQLWRSKKDHFNRIYIPTHIYHFNRVSLNKLLESCQYEDIRIFTEKEKVMTSIRTENRFASYVFHKCLHTISDLLGQSEILMAFARRNPL